MRSLRLDNYSMASGWVQQKVAAERVHDDPLAEVTGPLAVLIARKMDVQ